MLKTGYEELDKVIGGLENGKLYTLVQDGKYCGVFDEYGIGREKVKAYLQSIYPNWNEEDLVYKKYPTDYG